MTLILKKKDMNKWFIQENGNAINLNMVDALTIQESSKQYYIIANHYSICACSTRTEAQQYVKYLVNFMLSDLEIMYEDKLLQFITEGLNAKTL